MRTAAVAVLLVACGSPVLSSRRERPRAPGGPDHRDPKGNSVTDVPVHGAEVRVEHQHGFDVTGELLAVSGGAVWVENTAGGVQGIPYGDIDEVEVRLGRRVGGWAAIGAVSAVSHGWFVVFTLPLWAATGIGAGEEQESVATSLRTLREYARHPQGMPDPDRPLPPARAAIVVVPAAPAPSLPVPPGTAPVPAPSPAPPAAPRPPPPP